MAYFTKRYHKPGTPPGTLTQIEPGDEGALKISLVDYSDSSFEEKELHAANECIEYLQRPTTTWIHIEGNITPEVMHKLGELFNLHILALEDVLNTGQRPKVENYDDQMFVIMSLPIMKGEDISVEQVSLFVGENFIISFHHGENDPFSPIRKRLRNSSSRLRKQGADYLLYTLLDVVIDAGFPILEAFGEFIEDLEEELLDVPSKKTLHRLHHYKRELLLLRRMLWPQREALNVLIRGENSLIRDETKIYLRDCYDHNIQIMDLLESYRDMTASMLDIYLSSTSNRLNEIMRVLTVIATIFIPLTFLVGVYGMNFGNKTDSPWAMPELDWYYAYPILWIVMIGIAAVMLLIFKRKGWF